MVDLALRVKVLDREKSVPQRPCFLARKTSFLSHSAHLQMLSAFCRPIDERARPAVRTSTRAFKLGHFVQIAAGRADQHVPRMSGVVGQEIARKQIHPCPHGSQGRVFTHRKYLTGTSLSP